MYCLWTFFGIVRSPLLYNPLGQSNLVGGTVYCLWTFSGTFHHRPFLQSATSLVHPPVVGTYVYCLWTFYGIVRSPLLYSPLSQSNLVGGTVYCLWPFSGSFRHCPFLRSVTSPILPPLSAPTCIVYGHFTALFGRPFSIPLSPNQILSALTCISYGRFPALFGRFFCSIETSREPRRFTIAPSFEIVLTPQTIISKRAT